MTTLLVRVARRLIAVAALPLAALPLAALTLCLLAGCPSNNSLHVDSSPGAPQQVAGPDKLVAKAYSPVVDVPVPMGFDIDDAQSDAQVIGNVRYVSHYYKGNKGKDPVASFYCEQMVINHKWRQDGVWKNRGVWRLHFAKGNERCDIIISENIWGTTTAHVEIYPISPAPASGG